MTGQVKLGEILLREKKIDTTQLKEALTLQEENPGKQLGFILVELGYIDKTTLVKSLSKQAQNVIDKTRLDHIQLDSNSIAIDKNSKGQMPFLGEIMIAEKVITASQLKVALEMQKKKGGMIGMILLDLGYIDKKDLVSCLKIQQNQKNL
jgi:hypothetical protein